MSEIEVQAGSKWQHYNGNVYEVMCLANTESTNTYKYPVTVVVLPLTSGTIWSRPLSTWCDSMTLLPGGGE